MNYIEFKEPESCKYIYIDDKNKVHLLLPLVGGSEIGLDNTCQAKVEIRDFFLEGEASAKTQLKNYKDALIQDIEALKALKDGAPSIDPKLLQEKKDRLEQIEAYLTVFASIPKKKYKSFCKELSYEAELPAAIQEIVKDSPNAGGISLSPFELDTETSLEHPIFSLKRCFEDETGDLVPYEDGLSVRLETVFKEKSEAGALINNKSAKQLFIEKIIERWGENKEVYDADKVTMENNFIELKKIILKELVALDPNITLEDSVEKKKTPLNLDYVVGAILGDEDTSLNEWVAGIIDCGIDYSFWSSQASSIFYVRTNSTVEGTKIKVQFLLGEINFHCKINHLSEENFGNFFDAEPYATEFAQLVAGALGRGDNIEKAIFDYLNEHHKELGLSEPLTEKQQQKIIEKFTRDYNVIKESPHFDEFFVVDLEAKGNINIHQGRIGCHFLDFFKRYNPGSIPEVLAHHVEDLQQGSSHLNHKNIIVAQGHERVAKGIVDSVEQRHSVEMSIGGEQATAQVQEMSQDKRAEINPEERKQREKLLQASGFNDRLESLARKAVALRDQGHIKAAQEAETICNKLINHKEDYLQGGDRDVFSARCEAALTKECTQSLSQSRGFSGAISRIANAVSSVLFEKTSFGEVNKTSFRELNKTSMDRIKGMREALNTIKKPTDEHEEKQENTIPNGL